MATRTVSQTGPISASSTFGGSAFSDGDDIVNPAGNGFTLTIDQDATVAGFSGTGGNGTTVVNSGVTLTLTGNVVQGNANFTLGSGSGNAHLVFDTTAATRKFLLGTAISQASCIFKSLGTSGAHNTVSKTGSNYGYFDIGDENAGGVFNSGGYECTYTDFSDITNSAGTVALGRSDFGSLHFRLTFCTFDACGQVFPVRPYGWGGTNWDFIVDDCRWSNTVSGSTNLYFVVSNATGTGTRSCQRNAFDKAPTIGTAGGGGDEGPVVKGNYFDANAGIGKISGTYEDNVLRAPAPGSDHQLYVSEVNNYFFGDPDGGFNHHFCASVVRDLTHTDNIFEFSGANGDGSDLYFGNLGDAILRRMLVLPSETDGIATGNVCNPSTIASDHDVTVEHCTVVGYYPSICLFEAIPDETQVRNIKSCISTAPNDAVDLERAVIIYDGHADDETGWVDTADPAGCTKNYCHNYQPYTDPLTSDPHDGYRALFSTPPTGDLTFTTGAGDGAGFVDPTRSFANYAVYKGWATGGDSLRTRTDATRAGLLNDPSLGVEMIDWVRAGFAPTNVALKDAGHDSVTVGAVEWVSAGGVATLPLVNGGLVNGGLVGTGRGLIS